MSHPVAPAVSPDHPTRHAPTASVVMQCECVYPHVMEAHLSPSLQQTHKAANAVHDAPLPLAVTCVRTRDDRVREKTRATHRAHGQVPNEMDMV